MVLWIEQTKKDKGTYLCGHGGGGRRGGRRSPDQRHAAVEEAPEVGGLLTLLDYGRSAGGGILVLLQQRNVCEGKLRRRLENVKGRQRKDGK